MPFYVFKQLENKFADGNISELYSGPYDKYSDAEESYSNLILPNSDLEIFIIHNLEENDFNKIGDKKIQVSKIKDDNHKSIVLHCCDPLEIYVVISGVSLECKIETVKDDYVLVSFKSDLTGYRQEKLSTAELQDNQIMREYDINKISYQIEFLTNYNTQKHWVSIIPLSYD